MKDVTFMEESSYYFENTIHGKCHRENDDEKYSQDQEIKFTEFLEYHRLESKLEVNEGHQLEADEGQIINLQVANPRDEDKIDTMVRFI